MAGRGRGRGRGRLLQPPKSAEGDGGDPVDPPPPVRRTVAGRGVSYSSTYFQLDEDDVEEEGVGVAVTGRQRPREDATPSSDSDSEEDDFITKYRKYYPTPTPTASAAGRTTSGPSSTSTSTQSSSGSSGGGRSRRPPSPGAQMMERYPESSSSSQSIGRGSSSEEDSSGGRPRRRDAHAVVEKKGTRGEPVSMCVNFIRLEHLSTSCGVWEYHVDFPLNPALGSRRLRWGILRRLQDHLGPTINFDGGSKLYLPFQLPERGERGGVTRLVTQHPAVHEDVEVEIKFVKKNSLEDSVHFYNILLRQVMEKLGLVEMQRNFYDAEQIIFVHEHKLEIWPGYVTAIEVYEGGLMLNCDSSHRVLRSDTMLGALERMFHIQDVEGVHKYDARRAYKDYALGKIVLTKYNNKHYRVDDVDWDSNPLSTFSQMRGGQLVQTTFVDYYRSNYSVEIRDLTQPLLVTRGKVRRQMQATDRSPPENILLIPELCFVTGMTEEITSDFRIMKVVADKTRIAPAQRYQALQTFIRKVNDNPDVRGIFEKWGLRLADGVVQLNGRVITPPTMILGNQFRAQPENAEFTKALLRNGALEPIPVHDWLLICSTMDESKAKCAVQNYQAVAPQLGIRYTGDPRIVRVHRTKPADFRAALESGIVKGITQFVMVIIPSNRDDLYRVVKVICNREIPIASQVIRAQTLANERKVRSVLQKVALQINCKLGGALWTINIPLGETIMFLGMDVYHDPTRRSPSVTAVVATINRTFTKYYTRVIFQNPSQENISSLRPVLVEALQTFAVEEGSLPDRIIMFRDGVGDGQLELTKMHEVAQMLAAFQELESGYEPKFTFVVVQKRINARMFLQNGSHVDNVVPGTVLDHTVTRRYLFDFFLVSQLIREGTVNPTHYIVLHDSSSIEPNTIQKIAYATSFMYYNWSGSIRVPAMCQYAHKAAGLVGQHLGRSPPDRSMNTKLYYL